MTTLTNRTLGHDLANLLTVISGSTEIALRSDDITKIKKYLSKIQTVAEKMEKQLKAAFNPKVSRIDLEQSIISFRDLHQTSLGLKINISCNTAQAPTDIINKEVFDRVLLNLIKNSQEAEATTVDIHVTDTSIAVVDNGTGFIEDVLHKISNGIHVTTKAGGTGLGTQSVKDFCRASKWSLTYGNSKSGGAYTVLKFK